MLARFGQLAKYVLNFIEKFAYRVSFSSTFILFENNVAFLLT